MPELGKNNGWMTIAGWVVFAAGATLRAASSEAPGSPIDLIDPKLAEWILLAGLALAGVGTRRKDGKLMALLQSLPTEQARALYKSPSATPAAKRGGK